MKYKPIGFITVLLLITLVANVKIPEVGQIVPGAQAVHGGNPALLAVWHEGKKSNVVIDSSLTTGIVTIEINGTDTGLLKGFDITVTYSGSILTTSTSAISFGSGLSGTSSPDCPRSEGCVFDRVTATTSFKSVDNTAGSLRLAITITDASTPLVDGTGTLFRIKFTPTGTQGVSLINLVDGVSSLANPGAVPYQGIDGFFDNRVTLEFDYSVVLSGGSVTVVRPVNKVKFVDNVIANNFWNTGEAVVLDSDNDGVYDDPGDTVISGSPTPGATLKADPRLKIIDGNNDGAWQSGEGVIYDTNNNSADDAGEPVIVRPPLKTDSRIRFVDTGNSLWDPGETVVYDAGNNAVYDPKIKYRDANNGGTWTLGELVFYDVDGNGVFDGATDTVIAGTAPGSGTAKNDPKLRFVDGNGNGVWNTGETVAYDADLNAEYDTKLRFVDSNNNDRWDLGEAVVHDNDLDGVYDSPGDDLVSGSPSVGASLKTDPGIRYVDANSNNAWNVGEVAVHDSNLSGSYDVKVRYADSNNNNFWNPGEPLVNDFNVNGVFDTKVRFLDSNNNNVWTPGEGVVYDADVNGFYDSGERVLIRPTIEADGRIKFVDTVVVNNVWDFGEAVVYDNNNNNVYDSGELAILGSPTPGSSVKADTLLKFLDPNNNNVWDSTEGVVYDKDKTDLTSPSSNNNLYDAGEPVIARPPVLTDPRLKIVDLDGSGTLDQGEGVVYDNNGNGSYDSGDLVVAPLFTDARVKFVDNLVVNNVWDAGEAVVYDLDNGGTYNLDPVIAGTVPAIGTVLKSDAKIRLVDSDGNNRWTLGGIEIVIYDSNSNNLYDSTGAPPSIATALSTDLKVKYVDANGNNAWDSGEVVVYDSDSDDLYDSGELVIIGATPSVGTALATDAKVKYFDSNSNNVWNSGEVIVYDSDGGGLYDSGEPVIGERSIAVGTPSVGGAGTAPSTGTVLKTDTGDPLLPTLVRAPLAGTILKVDGKIRFEDSDGSKIWDAGETLIYDSDNNGLYDGTETVILGFAPNAGTVMIGEDPVISGATPVAGATLKTDVGEAVVAGFTPAAGTLLKTDIGDAVIAGSVPLAGTTLTSDAKLKYVDNNNNNVRDTGEGVVYDSGSNNLYDSGDPVIFAIPANLDSGSRATTVTVTVSKIGGTANPTVSLRALGIPQGVTASFTTLTGCFPCSSTLTLTVSGGPAGSAATAPAGIYGLVVTGNATVSSVHMVRTAGVRLTVEPPTSPAYTISSNLNEEAVVYDTNNNGQFDLGEVVFTGENPAIPLVTDSRIKFRDGNDAWDLNEVIVYDTDGDGKYDTGEPVISGSAPAAGTPGEADSKLKYFDTNLNSVWASGEPVVVDSDGNARYDGHIRFADNNNDNVRLGSGEGVFYDSNMNGIYDAGEPIIATATLRTSDSDTLTRLKFVDSNGNGVWNTGETVVRDSDADGLYDSGEPAVGAAPFPGTVLKTDANLRYVDTNNNLTFDAGEGVAYSTDATFGSGDTLIAVIPLKMELRLKFVDGNNNNVWDTGETVVRDTDNDFVYDSLEPVIAGTTPTVGTALKADRGETVITGSTPASNAILKTDSKIRFIDLTNSVWDGPTSTRRGEAVVYDSDNDGLFDDREGIFSRETPPTAVTLSSDPKLKFADVNSSGSWDAAVAVFQGQFALVNVNGTITSGTPEAVQLASIPQIPLNGGEVTFNPAGPALGFVSVMNVSAGTTAPGVYRFNVTAQSTGTFSESITSTRIQDFFVLVRAHDVSIVSVITTAHVVGRSFVYETVANPAPVDVKVTVANKGSFTETFTVTVKAGGLTIGTSTIPSLAAGASTTVTITWTAWTFVRGSYPIKAEVSTVSGEVILSDNSLPDGTFVVRLKGDVTNDCAVNIDDLARVGAQFGKTTTSPGFDTNADLNNDGAINIDDLAAVGSKFGSVC